MTPRLRKFASFALRLAICGLAVWWVLRSLEWTRFKAVLAQADWRRLVAALVALAPIPFLLALRLKWLLAANAVAISYARSVGVTFAGNFANFVLPGQTSGDVIKAVLIARDTDRRHEAATVVLFDRVLGLLAIVLLSGMMLLINWRDPAVKSWGRSIGIVFAAMLIPGVLYFSDGFRRLIRWDRLVERLPLGPHIRRIDGAVLVYREHRLMIVRCLVVTVLLQGFAILATYFIGAAVGVVGATPGHTLTVYYLYVPLCWIVGALPISPQGLGVVEAAYAELLHRAAGFGTAEGATMVSLVIRLMYLVWALPGVAYYLRARRATSPADARRAGGA